MAGKNKLVVKSEYIKKPHRVIQIEGKLSLIQHKCWNILALNALKKGIKEGERKYEISLTEIYKHLGYKAENDKHLKEALVAIMRIVIQGDIINKYGGSDWHAFVLLGHCYVKEGICHYEYTTPVIDLLSNPKQYVKLLMKMQNRFSSSYSLKLYEFLKTKYIEKQGRGTTGELTIEVFRQLMGLEDGAWPEFKVLKRDVILPAIKEINEKTDLFVELELVKNRQKVVALKFQITENPNKKQNLQGLDLESLDDLDFGNDQEIEPNNILKTKLEKLGFGENQINKFLNETDQDKVMDSVDYVLMRMEKGATIKDLTAYFNTILEMHREGGLDVSAVEDWRAKEAKIEQEKIDREKRQREEEEEKEKEIQFSKLKKEKIAKYKQDYPEEVEDICIEFLGRLQSENKTFILEQVKNTAKKQGISLIESVKIHLLTKYEIDNKIWDSVEEMEG